MRQRAGTPQLLRTAESALDGSITFRGGRQSLPPIVKVNLAAKIHKMSRRIEKKMKDLAFSLDSIPDVAVRLNKITLTLSFGEDADKLFAGWDDKRSSYYIRYKAEPGKPNLVERVAAIFEELPQKDSKSDSVQVTSGMTTATVYSGDNVAAVNANCRKLCALLEPVCLDNSLQSSKASVNIAKGLSPESYFKEIAMLIRLCVDNNLNWPLVNWRQTFAFDLVDDIITIGSSIAAFGSSAAPYREHVVPLTLVQRHAVKIAGEGASVDAIANFLRLNVLLVKVSISEADHLNRSPGGTGGKLLKESMPDGWEWGDDPMERLKAAGINVSLNRPIPKWEPWKATTRKSGLRSTLKQVLSKKIF